MKTAIVTDTNSGISVAEGKALGIYVVSMPVMIRDQVFTEGEAVTGSMLFDAMAQGTPVSTSQPAPEDVTKLWESAFADGAESVVHIPMSSGLSGECETAQMLARAYDGRVQVVDNHRISITQRSSVMDAVCLANKGLTADDIRRRLERAGGDAAIYLSVGTLEYLKKSGRITAAGAALATVFDLHPILKICGGKLDAQGVCRGEKRTRRELIRCLQEDMAQRFGYTKPAYIRLGAAGTFVRQEEARAWTEEVQKAFPDFQVGYHPLSCSIACHVGWDATAIAMAVKADGCENGGQI